MTKEELKQEAEESAKKFFGKPTDLVDLDNLRIFKNGYLASAEPREKQIAELEEKISVLLSCKNCSENIGGFICAKEYENKCLAQKIQFIKELEKENAELKEKNEELGDRLCNVANNLLDNWCKNEEDYCPHLAKLEKENAELKEHLKCLIVGMYHIAQHHPIMGAHTKIMQDLREAEQFLKETQHD